MIKKQIYGIAAISMFLSFGADASTPLITLSPTTSTTIQNPNSGYTNIEYQVTNQMNNPHTFTLVPLAMASQNIGNGLCQNPFVLQPHASCLLSISIDRSQLSKLDGGPQVCVTKGPNDNTPSAFMCSQPNLTNVWNIKTLDQNFPYGSPPVGNVCVSSDYYATPETMLGSWAMLQAVSLDSQGSVLPSFLTPSNVVYAVGTAAIGAQLGVPNCTTGCNDLNGYCFALKFNGKSEFPYMIFQSVNIAANVNSFDIYMAGGGSGAFLDSCRAFWGTGDNVDWGRNIQNVDNGSCSAYFGDYSSINSAYSVTYNGTMHPAKDTLEAACNFASAGQSGFNTQNFSNVSVVPVTCPTSLTQITGIQIPSTITTIGNQTIHNLSTLTDSDFASTSITGITTTQMQDCKTPSSGYCNNVAVSVPNYEASISADLTKPLLTGPPPSSVYCEQNPTISGYCSWNNGLSSGGGTYCNANPTQCLACTPGTSKWCECVDKVLVGCKL